MAPVGITLSSSSSFASTAKTVIAAHIYARANNAVMTNVVKPYLQPQGSAVTNFGTVARVAASALTEGVDLSAPEQLAVKITSTNPTEKGVIVFITYKLQRESSYPIDGIVARVLADAGKKKIDDDGITQVDSFAKSVPGASSTLDITHFRGAMAYMSTDNDTAYGPAPMPRVAVLHPEQISDIVLSLGTPATGNVEFSGGWSQEIVQNWLRGRDKVYGTAVFEDGGITRDATSDAKGAVFAATTQANPPNGALYYATEKEPRVQSESDMSLRGDEVGSFWDDQWGEMVDPWGVELFSDAGATI